ncbi:MAG: histidine phosphatase family protein [Cytophagales bacterium]|jgi:probable phosphoglycerate mutase|nr:histidine phosphatase family protein [Cytophagales bacterium]MCA6404627.1 histidine phosphatase family protein [Cytophagales bacterium]MCA6413517.1 histidine phosphatase family protein [Cytophagales bacterium]MCA6416233.1 histidine phosphatase family protein [Cytophagales bacterium]MCA6420394.1 histidine phosphatase family protein [Cytophagales bacterium]
MKVTLVRHAESESNAGLASNDPTSIALTERGRLQAVDFAENITQQPDLIIVTPYLRTSQTAMPLVNRFPGIKVETWPLNEFTYLSPATCRNTTAAERTPLVVKYWEKCDPYLVHGTGAESYEQFSFRIINCIKKLRNLRNQTVCIFTHGQVIRFFKQYQKEGIQPLSFSMKMFRENMLPVPIPNLSIHEFDF